MTAATSARPPRRAADLVAAGRPTAACPECGAVFDPSVDYDGHAHGPPRKTCSEPCRQARRNARRRELGEWARQTAGLRRHHVIEAAGQTAIGPELPPLPDPPEIDG